MPVSHGDNTAAPSNALLAQAPTSECDHMMSHLENVDLALADTLASANEEPSHVYFPTASFISLVKTVDTDNSIEVGLIGREGMTSALAMLDGGTTNTTALVQGGGSALAMDTQTFRSELAACPVLTRVLYRYLQVTFEQLAQNIACNRFHHVEPRLARWLLMTHDRAGADTFEITHQFIAYMLGVRRVGITGAASALQRRALIDYQRGVLTITDRAGLEAAACRCYATDNDTYSRVMSRPSEQATIPENGPH